MNYEKKLPSKIILNNKPEKSRGRKGVYIARRTKNFEKISFSHFPEKWVGIFWLTSKFNEDRAKIRERICGSRKNLLGNYM